MNINKDIMTLGVPVLDWTPNPEFYENDNIHPSVIYVEGGLNGFEWWMATTPIKGGATVENPILYWGKSREGNLPPLTWLGGIVVEETPPSGFNSDPCLYYDGTGIWVFWREFNTPFVLEHGRRATVGRYTTNGTTFTDKKLFAPNGFDEGEKNGDGEMCPIVVKFDGEIRLYASYYEYDPIRQPHGLAIWNIDSNDLVNNTFTLSKVVGLDYPKGFDFWHFDLFEHNSKFYCVATPEAGHIILMAESDDGENFKFWDTPLLSKYRAGSYYMYKPTAMVHQGIFYLWHPSKVGDQNVIYMSEMPFDKLINSLNRTVSRLD